MRISLLVGLILVQMFVGSFSSSAFAVCEAEREAFSQACESHVTWCKASEIVGIAGTIVTAPFAWGCGGLFGAIPAVVAKLKLEQIDMRQKALDACIARHNEEVRTRNIQALVPLAEKYLEMQSQIEDEYTAKIKNFIRFFIDEGYDINDSAVKLEIEEKRKELEHELSYVIEDLKYDHYSEIHQIDPSLCPNCKGVHHE
jgi:hypothetical protein